MSAPIKHVARTPDFPTAVKARTRDGRVIGVDNQVWLYMKLPMTPALDAKSLKERVESGNPLFMAFEELSKMPSLQGKRRIYNKSKYRRFHTIRVTVPKAYRPQPGNPNQALLLNMYPDTLTTKSVTFLGVRLESTIGNGSFQSAVESVAETLRSRGTPMADYDRDYDKVMAALSRCGLSLPTNEEFKLAHSWWNFGNAPDIPIAHHVDHIDFFTSDQSVAIARDYIDEGLPPVEWPAIPGQVSTSFAAASNFELGYIDASSDDALWAYRLIESDAAVISVRGIVEPPKITRETMRGQIQNYTNDIKEREKNNKMDKAELKERLDELSNVENVYANADRAPATLVETSVIAGFYGQVSDLSQLGPSQVSLNAMQNRQLGAWAETMIASSMQANPNLEDLPSTTIAYSGLTSLSTVGDPKGNILLGFTELDRQPAMLSTTAVSDEDTPPIILFAMESGGGKSVTMLWQAFQQAAAGVPNIVLDVKTGSDHSETVLASGGQVISLDDLSSSDGALDSLRSSADPQIGVDSAAGILLTVNPWGTADARAKWERLLYSSLGRGVRLGATCSGQALLLALEDESDPKKKAVIEEMIEPLFAMAEDSSLFRSFFGINPQSEGLRVANGTTYIKVGNYRLDLPSPGTQAVTLPQRLAVATVRAMFTCSAMALEGRDGVLHQDEAWVVYGTTPEEAERAGRLMRSMRVLPVFYSQDLTGALDAKLENHVSRVFIGPLSSEAHARAALKLARLEATPERLDRITAKKWIGSHDSKAHNWASMHALIDSQAAPGMPRKVRRGTIMIYQDLSGNAAPIEVLLPTPFLEMASNNRIDIEMRRADQTTAA